MSESKSLFGDYHEMADIWARIQAYVRIVLFRQLPYISNGCCA